MSYAVNNKTSAFSGCLIWFGAAVSIAEIWAGASFAPLGPVKGTAAIIIGHVIGGLLFLLAGLVGAKTGKCAMDTVKISFGSAGGAFFSALNVLQLAGWTAIMIIAGANAAETLIASSKPLFPVFCGISGSLVIIWVITSPKNLTKLNAAAMTALFALSCVMCAAIFECRGQIPAAADSGTISFATAVEIAIAMPLSWLPLVSDYTMNARRPVMSAAAGSIVYFFASSWMYAIGLGAALYAGSSDIAVILKSANMPAAGLAVIIFSTVTTTYLDVYSAGISAKSIFGKINPQIAAIAVCITGTLLAVFTPAGKYESFLMLISSVFVPMISILVTDFFITKRNSEKRKFNIVNFGVWIAGFALYRYLLVHETPAGSTIPVVVFSSLLTLAGSRIRRI